LCAHQRTQGVDAQHPVPAALVGLEERLPPQPPRAIHENIDTAEYLIGTAEQRLHGVLLCHVDGVRTRHAARRSDLPCDGLRCFEVEVGEHDLRALLREPTGDRSPDAAACPGDDSASPLQTSSLAHDALLAVHAMYLAKPALVHERGVSRYTAYTVFQIAPGTTSARLRAKPRSAAFATCSGVHHMTL